MRLLQLRGRIVLCQSKVSVRIESRFSLIVSWVHPSCLYVLTRLVAEGFGYKWSAAIRWEDLVTRREVTIRCPHADSKEASFRFQTFNETDSSDLNAKYDPCAHRV